ncbi:MAG TPA: nucleotide disphospho-sugar-binding domain-containing protein [Coleofasciculaceae cyanobacterium]
MSRILYVWELGDGYGHTNCFLPLALELRQRGHEIIFALRDLSYAQVLLGQYGFAYVQAPVWLPLAVGLPAPPLNYAEILHRFGYLDPAGLGAMVRAWRQLYEWVQPDLILADHAPTALLAARGTGIPRSLLGNGFFSPPRVDPTPNFRPWLEVSAQRLMDSDAAALATSNQVLAELGVAPLKRLVDLFEVEEDFLCTFPELDHYSQRQDAHYWGPIFSQQGRAEPHWTDAPGKRIFVYLRPRHQDFQQVLLALRHRADPVLIHAPTLPDRLIEQYQSDRLQFSSQPFNMAQLRATCDLAICHGGHGTTAAMLLAGIPLLLLPLHLEEYLLSQQVVSLGAGLIAEPEGQEPDYPSLIDRLCQPSFTEQAKAFAHQYAAFDQHQQLQAIGDRCEALIRRH